jgi:hypothetical protein
LYHLGALLLHRAQRVRAFGTCRKRVRTEKEKKKEKKKCAVKTQDAPCSRFTAHSSKSELTSAGSFFRMSRKKSNAPPVLMVVGVDVS